MYFHVTRMELLPSILHGGLIPTVPRDMPGEPSGVYLFPDADAVDTALTNWLGDRFEEDEDLVIIEVDPEQLEEDLFLESVEYERIYTAPIPVAALQRLFTEEGFWQEF